MAPPFALDSQAISGIMGSISIACWIIVFTPQLYENFRRQSSEGLSLTFVVLWLLGDIFNVLGSVLQGVLPTMLALAIYYTLADIGLLIQCLVYGRRNSEHAKVGVEHLSPATPLLDETAPLLDREPEIPTSRNVLFDLSVVFAVFLTGFLGWFFTQKDSGSPGVGADLEFDFLGQFFGYLCALFYLGSRLPQIILNFERKSCEGISFLFFLFACLGNLTYVISILAKDLSARYVLVNLSWLIGSVGTLVLDGIIFVQFWVYNRD